MPYRRKINYRRYKKKRGRRTTARRGKFKPRTRPAISGRVALQNKVELLSVRTLKPKSVMKKFIYYNTMEVKNDLIGGGIASQFMTLNLNSPWLLQSLTYSNQGANTWSFNTAMTPHSNGQGVNVGTTYPGWFDTITSPGFTYANSAVVGTKVTITAQPITASAQMDPTALFAIIETQPTALTNLLNIEDIYATPYAQVRKITGNQSATGGVNGNTKSARLIVKYSPKRFNNIKDLRDNHNFFATTSGPTAAATGNHPLEKDRLTFGICNIMTNPVTHRPCCPVMIQIKCEAIVLFTEPFNNINEYPALPAAPARLNAQFGG